MAEILGHAAVHMDAQHVKAGAAVGAADAAGIAVSAVEVGIDDYLVAHLKSFRVVLRHLLDDSGQLMADDARVGYQVIGSAERADIASADACADDPDQCLALLRDRLLEFLDRDLPRLGQIDSFHVYLPPPDSE